MRIENHRLAKILSAAMVAAVLAACASGDRNEGRNASLIEDGRSATVNRYLWSAALETLDFLPIASADPVAGLILTNWYSNPEAPDEQFKVSVYILDTTLRADALKVSVFKQARDGGGAWTDSTVNPATAREIENAILTRAREVRLNQIDD